jgi:hypothetical protein
MIMKKIILTAGLICGFMIPAFSQLNSNLKIDTTFRKLSIYDYQKPFNLGITKDYKNQIFSSSDNNLLFRRFSNKRLSFSQDSVMRIVKTQSYDNMPCINPKGFFPMRVYKPDSTVRYSMRVEKIK